MKITVVKTFSVKKLSPRILSRMGRYIKVFGLWSCILYNRYINIFLCRFPIKIGSIVRTIVIYYFSMSNTQ